MPELPDSDCLDRFRKVGRTYVLDLHIREMYPRVEPTGGDLETVARLPPVPYCRVAEKMSNTVAIRCGCTRMRGYAGNGHSPGETQDARKVGVPHSKMKCAEDSACIKPDSLSHQCAFGQ